MSVQTVDLGDALPNLSVNVYDSAGALAAASSVVLTVTLPDGSTATPTVSTAATGVYTASYTPTQRGRHVAAWVASGTNASAFTTVYNVVDPAAALVGLEEMQAYLGSPRTSDQDKVRAVIEAASAAVENYCNRTFRRTSFTEVYDGGKPSIFLRHCPVLAVSSVTQSGAATTNYTLNSLTGQLSYGTDGYNQGQWLPGVGAITVTYTAGATVVPQPVIEAVKMTAQSVYDVMSGSKPAPSDDFAAPADLIPRVARLMLGPYVWAGFGN